LEQKELIKIYRPKDSLLKEFGWWQKIVWHKI
jgi:hypothetical protein